MRPIPEAAPQVVKSHWHGIWEADGVRLIQPAWPDGVPSELVGHRKAAVLEEGVSEGRLLNRRFGSRIDHACTVANVL